MTKHEYVKEICKKLDIEFSEEFISGGGTVCKEFYAKVYSAVILKLFERNNPLKHDYIDMLSNIFNIQQDDAHKASGSTITGDFLQQLHEKIMKDL